MPQEFLIDGKYLDEGQARALFHDGRVALERADARQRVALEMLRRLVPPGNVVDIGCYSGAFTELIRQHCPGLHPIGCDPVDDHIRLATLLYPHVSGDYRRCSAYALEFPDRTFGGALLQEVIEHLDRPVDAVREIHRTLVPGGILIATTPNAASLPALAAGVYREARDVVRRLRGRPRAVPHEIFYRESEWNRHIYAWTVPTLTTLFLMNGYEYVEHRLVGYSSLTNTIPGIGSIIVLAVRKAGPAPTTII